MLNGLLVAATCFTAVVQGACVADFPDKLLSDPLVLRDASVTAAFEEVGRNLSSLYLNTTRDGLSLAIVCVYTELRDVANAKFRYTRPPLARCTHSTRARSR
jgi:hypothetical protein